MFVRLSFDFSLGYGEGGDGRKYIRRNDMYGIFVVDFLTLGEFNLRGVFGVFCDIAEVYVASGLSLIGKG